MTAPESRFLPAPTASTMFSVTVASAPVIYTLSLHDALPISPRSSCYRDVRQVSRLQRRVVNRGDRKSTRLNSSHVAISYAVFCLKKRRSGRHPGDQRVQRVWGG